ncbi:MAG: hypothetical protein H6722_29730 [Sandaracinus sp.]|nr:hypothetical protein [Sandaracinus sp.]
MISTRELRRCGDTVSTSIAASTRRRWRVRRFPELESVWVYPHGERWRLHLERLGADELASYGLQWSVGDFVVALLHTDAIGDGHIGEGKTVEVRVFDPAVVPNPTRDGFAGRSRTSSTSLKSRARSVAKSRTANL